MSACRTCGASLPTEDSLCSYCADEPVLERAIEPSGEDLPAVDPTWPDGLSLVDEETSLSLSWRHMQWRYIFTFAALIAAGVFSASWLTGGTLIALAAVTGLATYAVLVKLVNRTTVHATAERLRISSTPLPWWGAQTVAADDIRDIRCDAHPLAFRHHGRLGLRATSAQGPILLGDFGDEHAELAEQIRSRLADILDSD